MGPPRFDPPRRGGETIEEGSRAESADAHAALGEAADLADLIRQREAFARDVSRIEAVLARGTERRPALYEQLLRSRRISAKLENRIELVRLQRKIAADG